MSQKTRMLHNMNDSNRDPQNNENEESQNDEKDRYIYELVSKRHEEELERTNHLDGKASQIIAISGIILSLDAGILTNIAKLIPEGATIYSVFRAISLIVLVISFFLLLGSIILGSKAYSVKTWKTAPKTDHLLETYTGNEFSRNDILILVTKELNEAVLKNKNANNEKAKTVTKSLRYLVWGIVVLGVTVYIIFAIGILDL